MNMIFLSNQQQIAFKSPYKHHYVFVESGRTIPGAAKGSSMLRLFVTSGLKERLKEKCVYFLRARSDLELTSKNIHEVMTKPMRDIPYTCASVKRLK